VHIAALLTVEDGLVRDHGTFACYEPLPLRAAADWSV
jgi:hypothetical protein